METAAEGGPQFLGHTGVGELFPPRRLRTTKRASMLERILLLSMLLVAGCVDSSRPLEVRILPSQYQVGDVKSPLATPVVDEVVRRKPKTVVMAFCGSTPPAKTMQFIDELQARLKTELKGTLLEACPEA
jgi:hypothetical protein